MRLQHLFIVYKYIKIEIKISKRPVEAQLNIGADELANKCQEKHYNEYHPISYAYPASPAQLIINNHAITSQY